MKQEKPKPVPVDPENPENPVELLVESANYLVRQANAWSAIARDGAECRSAETQTVLMAELDRRLGTYRDRGLQALVHIVNDVVDQHNAMVAQPGAATKQTKEKEASNGMEDKDAHAGIGEGDVRREDQGVPPVGAVEAEGQGDADRGGAEEAPQGELRP